MSRRAAIAPDSLGLPGGSRRRTPGLRREEVAALAGIGVTWYTWFEQGRDIRVSARVLDRIARALRLSPSDADYLFSLSGIAKAEHVSSAVSLDESLQHALDGFRAGPAFLVGPCWDVLAFNRLADRVFEFDNYRGPFARNQIWRLFMDPKRRARYLDWAAVADASARTLRSVQGKIPEDPALNALVRALLDGSKEFERLWTAQLTVLPLESVKLGMKLPRVGVVQFTSVRFRSVNSQQQLVLLPPADEKSTRAMQRLGQSLSAACRCQRHST
jgi:transcriptional regulator with XRE-family HTH domain